MARVDSGTFVPSGAARPALRAPREVHAGRRRRSTRAGSRGAAMIRRSRDVPQGFRRYAARGVRKRSPTFQTVAFRGTRACGPAAVDRGSPATAATYHRLGVVRRRVRTLGDRPSGRPRHRRLPRRPRHVDDRGDVPCLGRPSSIDRRACSCGWRLHLPADVAAARRPAGTDGRTHASDPHSPGRRDDHMADRARDWPALPGRGDPVQGSRRPPDPPADRPLRLAHLRRPPVLVARPGHLGR